MIQSQIKSRRLLKGPCSLFLGLIALTALLIFSTPAKSDVLPNIVGRDLDGKMVSLHRIFEGRPTIVNFWATWCAPCKKELPDLLEKAKKYPDTDFIFVHAETDKKTGAPYSAEAIKLFLNRLGLTLPKLIIGNTKARMSAGVDALPTTMLVSSGGSLDQILIGFTPETTRQIGNWLGAQDD